MKLVKSLYVIEYSLLRKESSLLIINVVKHQLALGCVQISFCSLIAHTGSL